MTAAAKQPWFKFYPTDWQSDDGLRGCSMAARGLWIEMLCIMHKADGFLVVSDKPVPPKQLATRVGITAKECEALLYEMAEAGVYSVDERGAIYSRKMRRMVEKAARDKENGKGGGNPNLPSRDNRTVNPEANRGVNPHLNGEDKAQKPILESRLVPSSVPNGTSNGGSASTPRRDLLGDRLPKESLDAPLFRLGKEILGAKAGGVVKRLLAAKGGSIEQAMAALRDAAERADPMAYIQRCITPGQHNAASNDDPFGYGSLSDDDDTDMARRLRGDVG